jgi:hypothetical protein
LVSETRQLTAHAFYLRRVNFGDGVAVTAVYLNRDPTPRIDNQ